MTTTADAPPLRIQPSDAPMRVFDAIYSLRATRIYEDRPVPPEVVDQILQAGTMACSSGNTQPWEFVVVTDTTIKQQIKAQMVDAFATIDAERSQPKDALSRRRRPAHHRSCGRREHRQGSGDRRGVLEPRARRPHEARVRPGPRRVAARAARDPGRPRCEPVPVLPEHDAGGAGARRLVAVHDVLLPAPRRDQGDPRHPAATSSWSARSSSATATKSSASRGASPSPTSRTSTAGATATS